MLEINAAQRRYLRAQAHKLTPIVMVGNAGLSEAVRKEVDKSLTFHELLKIKVANDDRGQRDAMMATLCEALNAAPVQHIGKILVVYRPAEEPKLVLPA